METGRGKGLCSAIVREYQKISTRDQVTLYLEAGNEHAWGLYKRLGFVTVDVTILGKGTHGADGNLLDGGPGVKGWAMLWKPEGME